MRALSPIKSFNNPAAADELVTEAEAGGGSGINPYTTYDQLWRFLGFSGSVILPTPFIVTATGTGAGSALASADGKIQLTSGTTTGAVTSLSSGTVFPFDTNNTLRLEMYGWEVNAAGSGANSYLSYWGFGLTPGSTEPVTGVYFLLPSSVAAMQPIVCKTANSSLRTSVNLGLTPTAGTSYNFAIEVKSESGTLTARFYWATEGSAWQEATGGAITTNFPTARCGIVQAIARATGALGYSTKLRAVRLRWTYPAMAA